MDTSIITLAAVNGGSETPLILKAGFFHFKLLGLIMGYVATALIGGFGVVVIAKMARGTINLNKLVSEPDGSGASLSRFQFLIFTFVISMSLFWITLMNTGFPNIPNAIFILLGISGGSYLVSKGVQSSNKPTAGGTGAEE